jgi:hypothetical protein
VRLLLEHGTEGGGGRAGHQDVHAPECLADALEGRRHLAGLAQLELHREGAPAPRLDLRRRSARLVGILAIRHHAVRAIRGEPERDGAPDAARAARHHRHASRE